VSVRDIGLAVRAYAQGWADGSNTMKARPARTADAYHADYQRGFEQGRTAAYAAHDCYKAQLKRGEWP